MNRFPISIASYSFHGALQEGQMNIFSYLNILGDRYNVNYADIWNGFFECLEDDYIDSIRDVMVKKNIILANLCVDGPVLWDNNPEKREKNKKDMLKYIDIANTLGAKTIRIDFGGSNDVAMHEEGFTHIVNTYREYCEKCYNLGMKIGPENHWGWDKDLDNLKRVKEAVNHPAYGHLLHVNGFLDNVDEGNKFAISYAMHTHIPANSIPTAKKVIRDLYDAGYEGTYSIEHHSAKFEMERVEWQLGSVRGMIEEVKDEVKQDIRNDNSFYNDIYNDIK